jgi:hypothetical protein
VDGYLEWGVKASLRAYVSRLADGSTTVADGASVSEDGAVRFPLGRRDESGTLRSAGAVTFLGHGGELHIELRDPWVESSDAGQSLVITGADAPAAPHRRIVIASLEVVGDPSGLRFAARLTTSGAELLGPLQYFTRDRVDDLVVVMPHSDDRRRALIAARRST